ncbi:MAG: clpS [Enterobacter mori]|nr:clpS [Enterobacter mori]
MGKTNDWLDFDQLAEDKVHDALKPPSMYKVMLMNDDYTPMEFVIDVLQKFFSYDVERSVAVYAGKGLIRHKIGGGAYAQSRTGTQFKHGFRQSA